MNEDERKTLLADFALLDRGELEAICIGYAEVALDSETVLADFKAQLALTIADMRGASDVLFSGSEACLRTGVHDPKAEKDRVEALVLMRCAATLEKITKR